MDLSQKLTDLGFETFDVLDEQKGLARIRTSRGWDYQKFQNEDQVTKWFKFNKPEEVD